MSFSLETRFLRLQERLLQDLKEKFKLEFERRGIDIEEDNDFIHLRVVFA